MTRIFDSMPACQSRPRGPTTPNMQRLTAVTHARFSLFRFRSPLLTESRLLSLPVGTEMFHFPTFPPLALCVQARVTGLASSRVSPFGNPRITVWLSTPRGLSQIPTSFFGSWCQGIHRVPLETWATYKDARVHCVVLKVRAVPHAAVAPTRHTSFRLSASKQVCRAVRPHVRSRPVSQPRRSSHCDRAFRTQQRAKRCHRPPLSTPRMANKGRGCTCCAS
jgi:hypothetical protein